MFHHKYIMTYNVQMPHLIHRGNLFYIFFFFAPAPQLASESTTEGIYTTACD